MMNIEKQGEFYKVKPHETETRELSANDLLKILIEKGVLEEKDVC